MAASEISSTAAASLMAVNAFPSSRSCMTRAMAWRCMSLASSSSISSIRMTSSAISLLLYNRDE
ncbi:MAG: hypothetical protein A4E30_00121 [Methanomassiliicoccales archaeon PtaB.Bin215]|nr:MAG: hypothetical protein A4E30_00121 [Methanomassiliicoccales archaeon PtaB.Bin215]